MSEQQAPLSEFELISHYFADGLTTGHPAIELGIGDDCAILTVAAGQRLVMSIDTLVEGRHFLAEAEPFDIAYRALSVAVSDLAAMGASPLAFTLALTLPSAEQAWLQAFSNGLRSAAQHYGIALIGGDTTRGPLVISVQVHGCLPNEQQLLRSTAKPGDRIYVSGKLGDAAAALAIMQQQLAVEAPHKGYLLSRFNRPQARLQLGQQLLSVASAAIDISDGLLADLEHIAEASGVAATIYTDRLPLSAALCASCDQQQAQRWALNGGDDYELCFTVSPEQAETLPAIAGECGLALTDIGEISTGSGVRCLDADGKVVELPSTGYQHFQTTLSE